jgi:2-polyprenyl-3-methyl-5-hydroxy-6-metoxy-1,4-benzoquinol methylase
MTQQPVAYIKGVLKRYGPSTLKRRLWDREFSGTHWDFIDNTMGDCVYSHIEKHLHHGSILDLGCGPGNTANELAEDSYRSYVGVDISEAALEKARRRTARDGRAARNTFVCSDFLSYKPDQKFDVILFRESMYHVPLGKVKTLLDYFSPYLQTEGVFIVRMNTSDRKGGQKSRLMAAIQIMETNFATVEKTQYGEGGPSVIVFRPTHGEVKR